MSQQNKKMKVDDNFSIDPLKLQVGNLYEIILQHLSGKEILVISEVSRDLNKIIGNSATAMNKIQLVFKENFSREFDFEVVSTSERKYKHVKVLDLLRTRKSVAKVLRKFAASLCSIDTKFDFPMLDMKLPMLKSLTINTRTPSSYVEFGLLTAATNLEKLSLYGQSPFPSEIIFCLEINNNLKELVLEGGVQIDLLPLLTYDIGIGLQLKTLKIDNLDNFSKVILGKFMKFLRTQIDYIEEIKMIKCSFAMIASIFSNMKVLKRVTFGASQACKCDSLSMEVNPMVVELNLIEVNEAILKQFLSKAPKLEKLYVADPTWRMFDLVTYLTKSLREFRYAFFENSDKTVADAIAHYKKEGAKYMNVNKNISISQV